MYYILFEFNENADGFDLANYDDPRAWANSVIFTN